MGLMGKKHSHFFTAETVNAIIWGSLIFFLLGKFTSSPSFIPGVSIGATYAFLAFLAARYGPAAGFLAGFTGQYLFDIFTSYAPQWEWILPSAILGALIGLCAGRIRSGAGRGIFGPREMLIFNGTQILANAAVWLLVAPALGAAIHAEPVSLVFRRGLMEGAANILIVGIAGTVLLYGYTKTIIGGRKTEKTAS